MRAFRPDDSRILSSRGIWLRGVLAVAELPADVRDALAHVDEALLGFAQLLVFGHAGPSFYRAMMAAGPAPIDPVDAFARETVREHLEAELGAPRARFLFPGSPDASGAAPIPLQRLGALLGWHRASPLRVGISAEYGTWFAYRAVVAADTSLPLTPPSTTPTPCDACEAKPCLSACLGEALVDGALALDRCLAFRVREDSPCATRCPAREACPVGAEHRYDEAQIRYHYGRSLVTIRRRRAG